ncbi:MAG: helix-turn-helix transcriptional regulator [Bacilli bacterium]|nr:helix-turn-helix transcriptional regulator [Bacilli bacterium]
MKEINIGKMITMKRRQKGLTQEELANYLGVSKASVSKWETGQSYPDITFLPQLATFFNITIDELMGYEPQLTKQDILKLYLQLSDDFESKPFDEVLNECHKLIKKYYSCFPLLFHIGLLLVNNCAEALDKEKTTSVILEAKELFIRVKTESDDSELVQLATSMEAYCALMLGNPNEVIELLENKSNKIISNESLLASAYQMIGKLTEAKYVMQVGMYQFLCNLFDSLVNYLRLCHDNIEQFDETYKRALGLAEVFNLKKLHPTLLTKLYIAASEGYVIFGNNQKALEILEKYTELVTGAIYPLKLTGDDYFNLINQWIEELDLGNSPPRSEKIIRKSMAEIVIYNPAFTPLESEVRFKWIVDKLKTLIDEKT